MLATFLTWLTDAVQLGVFGTAVLLSVMAASWWGELGGIRPGRDKSGLGGFGMIYPFFALRWLAFAPLVVQGAERLPGGWLWWLLGHLLLGIASLRLFDRGLAFVQHDRVVPLWLCATGGVLLPAPAIWLGTEAVSWACVSGPGLPAAGLLLLHGWVFWQRRRELHRPPPPPPPSNVVDTHRGR